MIKKLVIVCTGNICRSPMAEELFKRRMSDQGFLCVSAGTHAMVGYEADSKACEVMAEHGWDISSHRAQQASAELLRWADVILALDQTHSDWVTRSMPQLRGRVFKLGKWDDNKDVEDPYRKSKAAFSETYEIIDRYVCRWVEMLTDKSTMRNTRQ